MVRKPRIPPHWHTRPLRSAVPLHPAPFRAVKRRIPRRPAPIKANMPGTSFVTYPKSSVPVMGGIRFTCPLPQSGRYAVPAGRRVFSIRTGTGRVEYGNVVLPIPRLHIMIDHFRNPSGQTGCRLYVLCAQTDMELRLIRNNIDRGSAFCHPAGERHHAAGSASRPARRLTA